MMKVDDFLTLKLLLSSQFPKESWSGWFESETATNSENPRAENHGPQLKGLVMCIDPNWKGMNAEPEVLPTGSSRKPHSR